MYQRLCPHSATLISFTLELATPRFLLRSRMLGKLAGTIRAAV